MKPSSLSLLLSKTIPERMPVLVTGAPGVGKSDIIGAAAMAAGAELIISHPVVSDPTDYKGLPYAKDGKAFFLPYGDAERIISTTALTVFLFDDLGQAPPSVQAACMQWLLARRLNDKKISDSVCFIAATNRKQDRAGVTGMLEPVKSRFFSIVELTPDAEDWTTWALSNGMPTELIAFMRFRPGLLYDFKPSAGMNNSPCPRTVANVGRLIGLGLDESMELEVYGGAAGEGFAVEFCAFLRMFRRMISPEVVLMSPDTAPIPDESGTLYALCTALARLVDDNSATRFFRYLDRLSSAGKAEFAVMAVSDAIRQKPEIQNTRASIEWFTRNQAVMV